MKLTFFLSIVVWVTVAFAAEHPARMPAVHDPIAPFIASMTKPVTAVAVLMLVEEGKLSIDDPASKYIPELGAMKNADGSPVKTAYGTQAWIDPVKKVAYILMVQRANFPNSDASELRKAFQNAAAKGI